MNLRLDSVSQAMPIGIFLDKYRVKQKCTIHRIIWRTVHDASQCANKKEKNIHADSQHTTQIDVRRVCHLLAKCLRMAPTTYPYFAIR